MSATKDVFTICDRGLAGVVFQIQTTGIDKPDDTTEQMILSDARSHLNEPLISDEAISGTLEELFARALCLLS